MAGLRMLRPGVTTARDRRRRGALLRRPPGRAAVQRRARPVPFPAVTCISINEEVVHGIPGSRKLWEGDIVSIDTGCRLGGWCGDAAATYPIAPIGPDVRRLLDVTRQALNWRFG